MALSETGEEVESVLRRLLPQRGYDLLNKPRSKGETGADIIEKKNNEDVFIECIGYQENPPLRSKQFYEGFFRTVSRLKDGAARCVLALPTGFNKGKKQRAKQYGEAWTRIGHAFPELEIWPVNVTENSYYECKWNDWPMSYVSNVLSTSLCNETSETFQYNEDCHLENCRENVKDIYYTLKKTVLNVKKTLLFNPNPRNYIGVRDKKQIAYIQPKKKELRLIVLIDEIEVQNILRSRHHKFLSHSKKVQKYWGGKDPNCSVHICDTVHWDEIQKIVEQLVKKYEQM
jgi:predicted transport protein